MTRALLLSAPPFSPALWDEVLPRLHARIPCAAQALVDGEGGPMPEPVLDAALAALGPEGILVAHGLAAPSAIAAAHRRPGTRLVLLDGPIGRLDPLSRALCAVARGPKMLTTTALQPALALRVLASSAGLRRAVRNPYVMDRDTVVAICGPVLQTGPGRAATIAFLRTLPQALRSTPIHSGPTLLLWGDEDRLYPSSDVDRARGKLPFLEHVAIRGGRWMSPVERPWEVADAIADWAERG